MKIRLFGFAVLTAAKLQRTITYFLAVAIVAIALYFAIYYRRPLGFLAVFSSVTIIVKNFICGPNSKETV